MTRHEQGPGGTALCNRRLRVAKLAPSEVPSCRSCLRIMSRREAVRELWHSVSAAALVLLLALGAGCGDVSTTDGLGAGGDHPQQLVAQGGAAGTVQEATGGAAGAPAVSTGGVGNVNGSAGAGGAGGDCGRCPCGEHLTPDPGGNISGVCVP